MKLEQDLFFNHLERIVLIAFAICVVCVVIGIGYKGGLKVGECVADNNGNLYKINQIGSQGGFKLIDKYDNIYIWTIKDGALTRTDCFDAFTSRGNE